MSRTNLLSLWPAVLRATHATEVSDADLVKRFLATRDPAAFEVLVWRYGPMVLGVCRRILRHTQDAEDAFQATFVVLARKAGAIGNGAALGGWLHKVAYRAALRLRELKVRRAKRELAESTALEGVATTAPATPASDDLFSVLEEELSRLPERYRQPLVLRYLAGMPNREAAQRLGCPENTLCSRLARGREKLRDRLLRRGFALPAAAFALVLETVGAPVSAASPLVQSAVRCASGAVTAIAAHIHSLSEGVIHMFFWNRVRSTIKCVILVGVFVLGTGLAALHGRQDDPGQSAGKDKDKEDSGGWSLRATHLDKVAAKAFVVALAPGGKTLAIGGADNSVRLWDVATGKDLGVLLKGHPDPVEALAFAPDGKRLAIGCGATAIVWDLSAGDIEKIVRTPREGTNQINGSREVITTMAFAPDGKVLAIGADATLNWLHLAVLSGKDKEIRQHVSDDFSSVYHEGPALVKSVAYCPKTNLIAVVGYNQDAVRNRGGFNATALVDPATNAKADGAALPDHEAALECADFAPDGKRLAVGTADKLVIVYDLDKRTVSKTLKGHEGSVRAVAYSPDGKLLASAGGDRSIRIWDAVKGEPVATLTGHKHSVLQLQFAAHGNTLTSVDASGAVNVWDRKGK